MAAKKIETTAIAAAIYGLESALHRFEGDCLGDKCAGGSRCEAHELAIQDVERVLVLLEDESGISFEEAEIMDGIFDYLK